MARSVPSRALPEVYVRPNAFRIAVEDGMTDLAVWSYRGCEAMSALLPAEIDRTWETVVGALTSVKSRSA